VSNRLRVAERSVRDADAAVVAKAAAAARRLFVQQIRTDTGGDMRMRNVGNAKLSVRTERSRETGGAAVVTLSGLPKGPLSMLDKGTKAHVIGRATGRRKRLVIGGRVVLGPVRHPGARGKRTWSGVKPGALVEARRAAEVEWSKVVNGG
jgi:hypothetical protein